MKSFLEWDTTAAVPAAKEILESMEVEALLRKSALKISQFLENEDLAVCELRAKQISHVLRALLPVHTYALQDGRSQELYFHCFCERNFSGTLLNGARFSQLVLDDFQTKTHLTDKMSRLKALEAELYFHAIALRSREARRKIINIF